MALSGSPLQVFKDHLFRNYLRYLLLILLVSLLLLIILRCTKYLRVAEFIGAVSGTITFLSILFAGFQFRANHDWNRRNAAIMASKETKESRKNDMIKVDAALNIIGRKTKEKLTVDEIHRVICKKTTDGTLERDKNGKLNIDHNNNGGEIRKSIMNILNSGEFIASGVLEGIFDESTIYRLDAGIILSTYYNFEDYIKHINDDMYPDRNGKIYENLRYLAKKFHDHEEKMKKEIKEREKTG